MRSNKAALLSVMAISSAIGGVDIPEPKPVTTKRKASKTYNTSQEQKRRLRQMANKMAKQGE